MYTFKTASTRNGKNTGTAIDFNSAVVQAKVMASKHCDIVTVEHNGQAIGFVSMGGDFHTYLSVSVLSER